MPPSHTVTRPIDGIPDPQYHIHGFTFNATFDGQENRWKAGQFMNLKADAPFYEAAFNARLAGKLLENGYAIRRTDRDFELASAARELIEKLPVRDCLGSVLPGLADFPINRVAELTPSAWAARNLPSKSGDAVNRAVSKTLRIEARSGSWHRWMNSLPSMLRLVRKG